MNIDNIIETHKKLDRELNIALSTLERKDTILKIREEIIKNQMSCPHYSNKYDWAIIGDRCPYCGYNFKMGD